MQSPPSSPPSKDPRSGLPERPFSASEIHSDAGSETPNLSPVWPHSLDLTGPDLDAEDPQEARVHQDTLLNREAIQCGVNERMSPVLLPPPYALESLQHLSRCIFAANAATRQNPVDLASTTTRLYQSQSAHRNASILLKLAAERLTKIIFQPESAVARLTEFIDGDSDRNESSKPAQLAHLELAFAKDLVKLRAKYNLMFLQSFQPPTCSVQARLESDIPLQNLALPEDISSSILETLSSKLQPAASSKDSVETSLGSRMASSSQPDVAKVIPKSSVLTVDFEVVQPCLEKRQVSLLG